MPQSPFYKVAVFSIFLSVTAHRAQAQTNSYSLHEIKKGETLSAIAKANKITVAELMHLNNLTAKSVLRLGENIKLPVKQNKASTLSDTQPANTTTPGVTTVTTEQPPSFKEHIVKPKESFSSIARQNKTTVADIMKLNGLNTRSVLKPGETIKIPVKEVAPTPPPVETMTTLVTTESKPTQTTDYTEHIIKPKESLYSIARANHTTVETIMRLNGMNSKSILKDGASIKIPSKTFTTIEVPVTRTPTPAVAAPQQPAYTEHTIKAKETLLSLAKANHTTITAILNLNDMKAKRPLKRGETIKIPSKAEPIAIAVTKPTSVVAPAATQEPNYTEYTIKSKETLSSVAKANHTTVGDIMRLNSMNSKSHLISGTVLRIPANVTKQSATPIVTMPPTNPLAKDNSNANAAVATNASVVTATRPIKYIVNKKDNLYKISKQFKTTEAQLIEWNGMTNDKIRPGMGLIVGQEIVTTTVLPTMKDTMSTLQKTSPTLTFIARDTSRIAKDATRVVKDTLPARAYHPTIDSTFNGSSKPVQETVARSQSLDIVDPAPIPKYAKYAEKEGFYAGYFDRAHLSENTTKGEAAAFKSTSGWEDKKFYILINDINQGSIVRITVNDKSICAKVVGLLPPVKEDNGLVARISTATAEALGVQDVLRFGVTINY